jgi:CRISPR-associated protein Cmx8
MSCIKLNYQLAELPSAQHRAGLAGLVLMVRELRQQPWFFERDNPVVEFIQVNEYNATLKLNLAGLKALFDLAYKASKEERATETKIKKYDRIEEKEVQDRKDKTKLKKHYIYSVVVPNGAFLPVWDKSSDEEDKGLWIKLWRDMLWHIIRGVPATRNSFNNRCEENIYSQDAEKLWQELKNPDKQVGQSGNYFLGAMASNAENISTKDLVKYQFLLHFWVFVAQVYCPMTLDKDGKREFSGYAIAVPDIANLVDFCDEFQGVLEARDSQKFGYLPRESIIDIPEEGALDLFRLLKQRISRKTGSQTLEDLILGVELIHAEKVGNNIKIRSISYVEPIISQVDLYAEIQNAYWCPWFRKQRLINLLNPKRKLVEPHASLEEITAWICFDEVLSRIPRKWLLDPYFSHDARELFNIEGEIKVKNDIRKEAQIVYQVCQHYVLSKLESKYQMVWDKEKKTATELGKPITQAKFDEKKYKIANEAFLAVRSRTENQAFID